MLSRQCVIDDIDPVQWKRLSDPALAADSPRSLYVVHEAGKVTRCFDTETGDQALPFERVTQPQAQADALLEARKESGAKRVWVLDLEAFHAGLVKVQAALNPSAGLTVQLAAEWEARWSSEGCAVAPKSDYLHFGLPWARLERFAQKMLPPSCVFVLGVFDGDELWATLFARIHDAQIVGISTSAALEPEDVRDVVGRDQHPFLLATVANRYRCPAFGWFCSRGDYEAYILASTVSEKDEVFQNALMKGKATFDFNVLIDRGMTALSPLNPGEAAISGMDREANPRTKTPDPAEALDGEK
ncbi:MAG: hypothetical protein ACREKE_04855 [bacterium]